MRSQAVRITNLERAPGRGITAPRRTGVPVFIDLGAPSHLATLRISPRGRLRLVPLQESLKQRRPLLGAEVDDAILAQEAVERFRRNVAAADMRSDPVVGGLEPRPSGNLDVDARFGPLGMAGRLVEFADLGE